MIRIYCSKADATLQETETLTAGMVNTPVVQFTFSSDWNGLGKSAIVRAGTVIKEVVVSNNQIVVPSECLSKAGVNLIIGVWGGNFTNELPTVWCACGEIQDATNPYSALNHEEGTPSNVAQMLAAAERAEAALDVVQNIIDNAETITDQVEAMIEIIPEHIDDNSEAWAVGKRFGIDVDEDDQTYHNNSKYYAGESHNSQILANAAKISAETYADEAEQSATEAAQSKEAATNAAAKAYDELMESVVPSTIETWLSANMSNPTDPAIDSSLTVSGAAADAGAINGVIRDLYGNKNKNLLARIPSLNTTYLGITISGNFGSGIVVNGTASSIAGIKLTSTPITLKANTMYILCEDTAAETDPIGFSGWRLDVRLATAGGSPLEGERYYKGVVFASGESLTVNVYLRIAANQSFSNKVIYPALREWNPKECHLGDTFDVFEPSMEGDTTFSYTGVQFRNNFDGSFTLNGKFTGISGAKLTRNTYGKMALEKGHLYYFCSHRQSVTSDMWGTPMLDIRDLDSNILVRETSINGSVFTPPSTGLYDLYLRSPADYVCNDYVIKPQVTDITYAEKTSPRVRVCAFNVGNFHMGSSAQPDGTDEIYNGLISTFRSADADVYMFSEWDTHWDSDREILADDIFGSLKPYKTVLGVPSPSSYIGQRIFSDYPLLNDYWNYFGDAENRIYLDSVSMIGGKPVHFICTHFPWTSKAMRISCITKVFKYIQDNNIEYYVLGGDFNTGIDGSDFSIPLAREDIDLIESYGCTSAQGSMWGLAEYDHFMNTFRNTSESVPIKPYDNIVVSKNIHIRNVFVVETTGSDHHAICADLEVM